MKKLLVLFFILFFAALSPILAQNYSFPVQKDSVTGATTGTATNNLGSLIGSTFSNAAADTSGSTWSLANAALDTSFGYRIPTGATTCTFSYWANNDSMRFRILGAASNFLRSSTINGGTPYKAANENIPGPPPIAEFITLVTDTTTSTVGAHNYTIATSFGALDWLIVEIKHLGAGTKAIKPKFSFK